MGSRGRLWTRPERSEPHQLLAVSLHPDVDTGEQQRNVVLREGRRGKWDAWGVQVLLLPSKIFVWARHSNQVPDRKLRLQQHIADS